MNEILNKLIYSPAYSFLYKEEFLGDNIILLSVIQNENSKYSLRGITLGTEKDIIGRDSKKIKEYHDKETDTIIYTVSEFFDNLFKYNIDCIKLLASNNIIYMSNLGEDILSIRKNCKNAGLYKLFLYKLLEYISMICDQYRHNIKDNDYYIELIESSLNIIFNYINNSIIIDAPNNNVKSLINTKSISELNDYLTVIEDDIDNLFIHSSGFDDFTNKLVININKEKIFNNYSSTFIKKIFLNMKEDE